MGTKASTKKTTSNTSNRAKPKVSVVLSVYNMENYLRQCLDSILDQTFREIELICIDDSSTDSSFSILEEYADRDPRIKVERQDHAGAGAARNKGMTMAEGEYLSILDADDYFEPDMIEQAYGNAVENQADIVVFRCDLFDQKSQTIRENDWSIIPARLPRQNDR